MAAMWASAAWHGALAARPLLSCLVASAALETAASLYKVMDEKEGEGSLIKGALGKGLRSYEYTCRCAWSIVATSTSKLSLAQALWPPSAPDILIFTMVFYKWQSKCNWPKEVMNIVTYLFRQAGRDW